MSGASNSYTSKLQWWLTYLAELSEHTDGVRFSSDEIANLYDLLAKIEMSNDGPNGGWIPLKERLPEERGWVLCAHPVLGIDGVVIRDASEVRSWADPQDKSMIDACWMPLPASPFATGGQDK